MSAIVTITLFGATHPYDYVYSESFFSKKKFKTMLPKSKSIIFTELVKFAEIIKIINWPVVPSALDSYHKNICFLGMSGSRDSES